MIKDVGKEVYGRIAKDKSRSLLKGYTKDSFYGWNENTEYNAGCI